MPAIVQATQRLYVDGGSDRMVFDTMALLEARGYAVIPFAARDPRNVPSAWERYFPDAADFEHPGPTDIVRYLYSRPARRSLARLLREQPVALAHLHITYGKLTASILEPLRRAGVPIVRTLHEYKPICPVYTLVSGGRVCEACQGRAFYRALPRRCNRGSLARTSLSVAEAYLTRWLGDVRAVDRFIAISDFQRAKMVQHGLPADRIRTIHNFVTLEGKRPAQGDGAYLLYFGRLERLKGIFTLLEAVRGLDFPVKIVGRGAAEAEIRQALTSDALRHVELLGFRTGAALADVIRGARAVVVPSEWLEPFGLTVIEAMAYARPVVASSIGGLTELVEPGVDGALFEPGDAGALRAQLRAMILDPARALALGRAGRRKVERSFAPEVHLARLLDVYAEVLGGEPPRGGTPGA